MPLLSLWLLELGSQILSLKTFVFEERVSFCNPDSPGMRCADQAGLELSESHLPREASAGVKGHVPPCPARKILTVYLIVINTYTYCIFPLPPIRLA